MRATAAREPVRPGREGLVLAFGIAGLATGFLLVTLLCAVVAITMASLHFQAVSAGVAGGDRRGTVVAGMVCGIAALALWIPAMVAVAVARA